MQPFPEEVHRRIAGLIAGMHFVPTEKARCNLLHEHAPAEMILLTGNPVVDALHAVSELPYSMEGGPLATIPWEKRIILVTAHRCEDFGQPLASICDALQEIVQRYHSSVHIVYPVHMNPQVWKPVHR